MKLDILAFGAHPDDVELACSGVLMKEISSGKKVGIIDLTEGELGTRGSAETRYQEANDSSAILGIIVRENLNLGDGTFSNILAHQLKVIAAIRKYKPEIIISNALYDRHPDHGKGADLLRDACFYSGLKKKETSFEGVSQEAWRPKAHYHYIQDKYIEPDFVVDITDFWERKVESIRAYKTQFFDPNSKEENTYISNPDFLTFIEGRALEMGHKIGVKYGEGFTVERKIGVNSLLCSYEI